jgi:hypothetical protein
VLVLIMWKEEASVEFVGDFKIDVDAPLPVVREKIRRRLREPLNKKNGEGFIFLVGRDLRKPLSQPWPRDLIVVSYCGRISPSPYGEGWRPTRGGATSCKSRRTR